MGASQYKDYILTLLFMKYVSDRYAGQPDAIIEVSPGGSFADMVKLKGDKEIGDKINKIIGKLADANDLKGVIDQADFNDESKLGSGCTGRPKEEVPTNEQEGAGQWRAAERVALFSMINQPCSR